MARNKPSQSEEYKSKNKCPCVVYLGTGWRDPPQKKKTQKSKNKQTENPKDKTKQNKARNREWKDLSGGDSKGILESSWLRFSLGMVS